MKRKYLLLLVTVFLGCFTACEEDTLVDNTFGKLTGKVVSTGENQPLANVKISTTPVSTTVFTDAEGNFEITDIVTGDYSVQAELEEYQTAFEPASIVQGKTVNVVFEMESVDASNLAPLTPNLLLPEDGAKGLTRDTEFVWSSSVSDDDEILYTLELRNGATNSLDLYEDLKDTTLVIQNLAIGVNYFWQITANDGINAPVKSGISSFETKGPNSNRFLYVRNIEGNNVIFSGTDPIGNVLEDVNQNEFQLTGSDKNSYRPRKNRIVNRIAFLRSVGGETHLFSINEDGSDVKQITSTIPVAGFKQEELEYAWANNGSKLYYANFSRLYAINADGTGNQLIYETTDGNSITEIAINPTNALVALKTNNNSGYNARIVVVDTDLDLEQEVVAEGFSGAFGGLDFSIDGTKVLYTRDVSGSENSQYRQLDSRIFEYSLVTNTSVEISTNKTAGTNDTDPKYSPDDGAVIFTNASNDGVSEKRIYRVLQNQASSVELMFTNAYMPDWE
jgi:hypothetical protein